MHIWSPGWHALRQVRVALHSVSFRHALRASSQGPAMSNAQLWQASDVTMLLSHFMGHPEIMGSGFTPQLDPHSWQKMHSAASVWFWTPFGNCVWQSMMHCWSPG